MVSHFRSLSDNTSSPSCKLTGLWTTAESFSVTVRTTPCPCLLRRHLRMRMYGHSCSAGHTQERPGVTRNSDKRSAHAEVAQTLGRACPGPEQVREGFLEEGAFKPVDSSPNYVADPKEA